MATASDAYPHLFWFCCLNPVERAVLRSTALAFGVSFGVGVHIDVWNAFWGVGVHSLTLRKEIFHWAFHCEVKEILPDGATEFVTVVAPTDILFWAEILAYTLSPDGACLQGCVLQVFP